ncbi:hypothetical protein [Nostoc cycadae]|uniref:Uncharacterized protein n=1 Tax=Nostoc cycadae WK-1 TaxID=1861711 RepID=A0A2H6LBE2_9NOSO|nr:hypothetical protein [Nostoc cycadae]GBE90498.1 hypothetical protein NCWK1_0214 [Nostoc cycadae WK-1]
MKIDTQRPNCAVPAVRQNLDWLSNAYSKSSTKQCQSDLWVRLLELPSPYSFDEALLLCQVSADEWLAWVPDHGEVKLHSSQWSMINSY